MTRRLGKRDSSKRQEDREKGAERDCHSLNVGARKHETMHKGGVSSNEGKGWQFEKAKLGELTQEGLRRRTRERGTKGSRKRAGGKTRKRRQTRERERVSKMS